MRQFLDVPGHVEEEIRRGLAEVNKPEDAFRCI